MIDAYPFRVPGGLAPAKSASANIPSKMQPGQKGRDTAAEPVNGDTDRSSGTESYDISRFLPQIVCYVANYRSEIKNVFLSLHRV